VPGIAATADKAIVTGFVGPKMIAEIVAAIPAILATFRATADMTASHSILGRGAIKPPAPYGLNYVSKVTVCDRSGVFLCKCHALLGKNRDQAAGEKVSMFCADFNARCPAIIQGRSPAKVTN
jgi:hypothetical protein